MAAGLIPMTASGSHAAPPANATTTPQTLPHPAAMAPPHPSPYVHLMSHYHQATGLLPPGLSAAMAAAAASAASVTPSPIALMAVAALTSSGGGAVGADAGAAEKKPPPTVL